jgi:hypothetical protein
MPLMRGSGASEGGYAIVTDGRRTVVFTGNRWLGLFGCSLYTMYPRREGNPLLSFRP